MRVSPRLEQLTGLRFFAALFVLLSHLEFLQAPGSPIQWLATTVFYEGYSGVSFFYVLSGFILSHTYGQQLAAGAISRRRYFMLRVVRIFPLHVATALPLVFVALRQAGAHALPAIALNLSLLQSWSSDKAVYYSLNGVSWSLSDELFFYAAFAGLVFFRTGMLLTLALAWAVAAIALAASLGTAPAPDAGHWALYILPAMRLLDFVVGMLLHRLFRRREATASPAHWTLLELAAVGALLTAMFCFPRIGLPLPWRYQLAYLPIMAGLVYVFAYGRGLLSRGLSSPVMVLLGNASFALYMIHQPLAGRLVGYGGRIMHDPLLLAALTVLVCVGASVVVYRFAENPVHKALRRRVESSSI